VGEEYTDSIVVNPEVVKILKKKRLKAKSEPTTMDLLKSYTFPTTVFSKMAFNMRPPMGKTKEEYEKEVNQRNALLKQMPIVEFILLNEGSKPATNIDFNLTFPKEVVILNENEIPPEPSEPGYGLMLHALDKTNYVPNIDGPESTKIDDSINLAYWIGKIKHTRGRRFPVAITNETPDGEYIIQYQLHCEEDIEPTVGKLKIVVNKTVREEIEWIEESDPEAKNN